MGSVLETILGVVPHKRALHLPKGSIFFVKTLYQVHPQAAPLPARTISLLGPSTLYTRYTCRLPAAWLQHLPAWSLHFLYRRHSQAAPLPA